MTQYISKYTLIIAVLALFIQSCSSKKGLKTNAKTTPISTKKEEPQKIITPKEEKIPQIFRVNLPTVEREFRAAWIATVANINWPSKNNISTQQQKQEAIHILDQLKEANFNAVIFQARPSADALYKSELEPWSYFLTGTIGKAPSPYYDPLEFWIEEAHKRGMELHIWLNPYRVHHTSGGNVTAESMVNKMPQQTYRLRNGMYWLDPSDTTVQNHVSKVINDIVKRYDIDAVHIDDYFYPYKEYNGGKDFPDQTTWEVYKKSGGTLSRSDWRRANVNQFIKRIHQEIKTEKPYVKFGISPFGIWKPGYPSGITGLSQYDELFADAKLWLNEGWCDYFVPQLYWKEGGPQSFSALLKWWEQENYKKIHLWAGLNTVGIKSPDKVTEIVNQIHISRNILGNRAGEVHYSMDGISKNPAMFSALKETYKTPALVPKSHWIKTEPIVKPEITVKKEVNSVRLDWLHRSPEQVRVWVLYTQYNTQWEIEIIEKNTISKKIPTTKQGKNLKAVAIKAVDRLGNESDYSAVQVAQ